MSYMNYFEKFVQNKANNVRKVLETTPAEQETHEEEESSIVTVTEVRILIILRPLFQEIEI